MKFKRGFSLLELLLVMTIVAVVFIFSTPFSMNFYRTQLINDVQSNLIDTLQRARHNAVLQKNDSNFGVHIDSDSYTLFQTPNLAYASRVSDQDEVFPVVGDIDFGGPAEIIFSKLTGIPSATGTIAIAYDVIVKGITVDSSGVISKDDNVVFVGGSGCVATGGATSTAGGYMIHTFTTVGEDIFTVTSGSCDAEVLVVAGGGGGGKAEPSTGGDGAGGGGAGGLLYNNSYSISARSYPILVGSGGLGSTANSAKGGNGTNSSFDSLVAIGGGGGGTDNGDASGVNKGANGGSGGGAASMHNSMVSGGVGTTGQGNKGGNDPNSDWSERGGAGGGGAGTAGGNVISDAGSVGGSGLSFSITGSSSFYAGGGGGGAGEYTNSGGAGGSGVGGSGGILNNPGENAVANTGSGGGGGGTISGIVVSTNGGNGSSGVVIIKYLAN